LRQGLFFTNDSTSDDTSHVEYSKNIKASETCGNVLGISTISRNPDLEHVKKEIGELKGKNVLNPTDEFSVQVQVMVS